MSTLLRTASWVIRERATGRVIMETFSDVAKALKPEYEAVPILEHLQSLNARRETTDDYIATERRVAEIMGERD